MSDSRDYPLHEGSGQPPRGGPTSPEQYVPAVCPLCYTRLYAKADQVGRQIVCPDCETSFPVPRPLPKREVEVRFGENDGYDVREPDGEEAGETTSSEQYVPAVCPMCYTRHYVTADRVGREMLCPDCNKPFTVRQPREKLEGKVQTGENDSYDVREPAEEEFKRPAPLMPGLRTLSESGELLTETERPRPGALSEPLVPPRWTFFSGVVQLPFYRGSWGCWLGLSAGLMFVLGLAMFAVAIGSIKSQFTWIMSMFTAGATFALGGIWTAVATAFCLAILRDTAEGYDEIENWPEMVFVDWMLEVFFIFNALGVAALVGMGAGWLFKQIGWTADIGAVGGMFLTFPIVFVSMLEMNSPLKPLSLPVLQSLREHWRGWAVFYAESAALLLLAGIVLVVTGIVLVWVGWFIALPLASFALTALLMIQFRLFGRLIWFCGGKQMPRQT